MPTDDTFDILSFMILIGLILITVGSVHPPEPIDAPMLTMLPSVKHIGNLAQETSKTDKVESEADLWVDPQKKEPKKKPAAKKSNRLLDKKNALKATQPQTKQIQELNRPQKTVFQDKALNKTTKTTRKTHQKALTKNGDQIMGVQQNVIPPSGAMEDLASYWEQRRMHLSHHDYDLAQRDLKLFLELKRELGARNAFFEANVLLLEAERARQTKDINRAQQLVQSAKEMAPDLQSVYLFQASLWFSENYFKLGRIISALVESISAGMRDPLTFNRAWINWLVGLLLGLGLSSVVIVVLQLIRVMRLFFHDFHHLFPKGATFLQTSALGVIVILLPMLFRLGFVLTFFLWMLITWLYQTRREKMITFLILIFFTFMPLSLQTVVSGLLLPGSKFPDLLDVNQGLASTEGVRRINEWIKDKPDNPLALSIMGDYHKRTGRLQTAEDNLKKALKFRPDSAVLANNLGNVLFLSNQVDPAIRLYTRATELQPGSPIPFYNLSRAYYKKMDLSKGKHYHSIAYRLNPDTVRTLSEKSKSRKINDVVADLPIPRTWLFNPTTLGLEKTSRDRIATHIWNAWGGIGSAKSFPFIGIGLMIACGLVLLARRRIWLSSACIKCGRPACRRCNTELYDDLTCGQCFHSFVQKDRVDAKSKISKEIQIRQYLRRRNTISRTITFAIPGAGHFIRERPLKGAMFLTIFCLSVVQILIGPGILKDCRNLVIGSDWVTLIPWLLLLLSFYPWAIIDIFKMES